MPRVAEIPRPLPAAGADGAAIPPATKAGFTLIELMAVLLLMGLAIGYGTVKLGGFVPSARLESGAREIGDLLTRARGLAVFQGTTYQMEYDLDQQRYRLIRPATEQEQQDGADPYIEGNWFELPTHVRIEDIQISDRDNRTNGTYTVEFLPTGEVFGHLVHLISDDITYEDRNRFTVEMNPITGLVTYTPGRKEYRQIRDEYAFR
jgi:type II secretion system protein H